MRPRDGRRQTLRGKFLRVTIPLIFLSVIGVFALIELLAHRNAVARLEENLEGMIRTQAAALANPVWNLDREQIRLSLEAVVTNREIVFAQVLGEKGEVMSAAGAAPEEVSREDLIPLSRNIIFNAGSGDRVIGTLEFTATRRFLWEQTRNRLLIAAVIALVAVSIEVAAALYALRSIIGRPLARLLASINQARTEEERQPVTWHSTDELGQVIDAYNQMQAQQQSYEAELRAARDTLEDKVAERTEELASKSRQMEQLSSQLAKYLSPQVYESIFSGRQEVKVAATRKKLTVFFSDIADFTQTADRMESEELTQLLNHYLTEMSRIALSHGATIDKYVGDAILLFFGDPESKGVKEDAVACVEMALTMRQRLAELSEIWRGAGIENPLQCRMGIHTGYCTVGNFGSEDRLDYTIIGSSVNTASRLESLATPGEILISYETYAHVCDRIRCEEYGQVEVKGLAYPIATFRVIDTLEPPDKQRRRFCAEHPAVKLEFDLDAMTADDRNQALEILRQAQTLLSESEGFEDAAILAERKKPAE
ncbi:adenylate/guanylate cyclase domain-containing protein [Pelagibius sp. CAU 1746]|uniref:adenylate/guanylate cyclase domain-containing protein n=1 Tax=Pelagibius sp. CAU 1746 TaxID=3140370 RepID=UPI00325A7479